MQYFYEGIIQKCDGIVAPEMCSWGGENCFNYVPAAVRIKEFAAVMVVVVILYFYFEVSNNINKILSDASKRIAAYEKQVKSDGTFYIIFNKFFSILFMVMFIMIVYYKFNVKALLFTLQPCHLMLFFQSVCLWRRSPTGVLVSILLMPTLVGTLLASVFPDTSGLDQPLEELSYWVQHFLIQVMPFYLICKDNFMVLKMITNSYILIGVWFLLVLHWPIFDFLDSISLVNINFMLCPTKAMLFAFTLLPPWVMYPSYRTAMFFLMQFGAYLMAYFYKFICLLFKFILEDKKIKDE